MNIGFIAGKGGASKTTYTRLVGEYFQYYLREELGSENYTNKENEILQKALYKNNYSVDIFNITNSETSISRFNKYFENIEDIVSEGSSSFSNTLMMNVEKGNKISLFDFGADIYATLIEFEKTENGKRFFSSLDFLFIPIKHDEEYIKSAYDAITIFKQYDNIKFIFCFTDFHGDIKNGLKIVLADKRLLNAIDKLEARERAKTIYVPFSMYIRESNEDKETLQDHQKKQVSEDAKDECNKFSKDLFDKFNYAFFNLNRDAGGSINFESEMVQKVGNNYENNDSEKLLVLAKKTSEGIQYIHQNIEELKKQYYKLDSLEKLASAFVSPKIGDIYDEIQAKYVKNTKTVVIVFIFVAIVIPVGILSFAGFLTGKYFGAVEREELAFEKAKKDVIYVNNFIKELKNPDILDELKIEYNSKHGTAAVYCGVDSQQCKNVYDESKNIGYLLIQR